MLGDTELSIDERIKVMVDWHWRVGFVRFERYWQSFYLEQPGKVTWMWEGLLARPTSGEVKPG
jgi:hypothetical protein